MRGNMREHIHTGFPTFVYAGLSAIVMIQILRFIAAQLVDRDGLEPVGKMLGSLVTFS